MNKKIIILMIAMILLAGKALALGVSPGRTTIDFEPNMERVIDLRVINNEQKDLSIALNAEGELSGYISFDKKDIHLSPSEGSKTVSCTIKLPEKIERPGMHETNIILREAKSVTGEGVKIGASLAVISIIGIRVPYQGKYAEANLFVTEPDQEDEITFVVTVTNLGKEDISKTVAEIEILSDDRKIATLTTDEKSVKQGARRELLAKWKATAPGKYKAKAKVDYDEKTTEAETEFSTKGFFLKLIDISVTNFQLGSIAKFKILLENIANKKTEDVYTKMVLNDKTGKNIMDIESQRETMQPQERKEVQAYWDTETVKKGEYDGKVTLHANEEKWETPMVMDVQENKITTKIGPTAMAVADTGTDYKTTPFIAILVIALIGVNIGWYVYFKKRKKDKKIV
ncbi:MAG: hypothetical protein L6408_02495 [Nanoarchaeota archaeon]|nr:hypothetical protein [Nanoarchaeota archaeon]